MVHFHGSPAVVERELVAAGVPAVLVCVNYSGLSAAYARPFADAKLFGAMLAEVLAGLKARRLAPGDAVWQRVCVSSFSAGFGAVRAILRVPEYFDRVDALYLADTLYAGYVGDGPGRTVDPAGVADFCRFAAAAAEGRKRMIVTHSYLQPGSYAGTHETADELIRAAGAARREVDDRAPTGARIVSRAERVGFAVWGFAGRGPEDHMAHLRNLRFGYRLLAADGAHATQPFDPMGRRR